MSLSACADHEHYSLLDTQTEPAEADEQAPSEEPASMDAAPRQEAAEPPHSAVIEVTHGEFVSGAAPAASAGAADAGVALPRIVSLTGPSGVTNGGTANLRVTLEPAVANPLFVVSVDGDSGYHTVTGSDSNGDGVQEIQVQVRSDARQGAIVIEVAPTDGKGQIGEYRQIELTLVPSGVGDVKVTLSFEPIHDLDLHVIEPSGTEIYFAHPTSPTGGKLDLDSGANCTASVATSENIYWPAGAAPTGQYRVRVQDFEPCDRGPIPFTVRIENGAV
ncbi:MAG TPA: hypothetical protein VG963_29825, partial [Polyangiaceae bacterium]|nr:hypothetical protein [Polyangiaceae bacterium]